MNKNININGEKYLDVSKIKVKDAETEAIHTFLDTEDGDIKSSDVMLGKVGYGKDGKVIGSYIPQSGEIDGGINFYDQYGAWLTSYSLADLPLSALPEIPALDGAGADQYEFAWTMTLEEVNALTEEADIGVDVTAKEGAKTYLLPNHFGFSGSTGGMYFYGGNEKSTILIDWGDGTANTTLTINPNTRATTSHSFATKSYNPITISLTSGGEFYLGGGGSNYNLIATNTGLSKQVIEVRVGKGVKGLTVYPIASYSALENILLHNGLYDIYGTATLFSAYSLKSLNIPKSLKELKVNQIAYNCYALQHLYIHDGLESSKEIVEGSYALKRFAFPKTYKTFNGIRLFYSCPILTKIKFPKTPINCLGDYFYIGSSNSTIEEIDLSNFVAEKYQYMMQGWKQLKQVIIPEGVKELNGQCFQECYNLESVTFPASLEKITGSSNFYSSYGLKQVIFKGTTPPIVSGDIFTNTQERFKVYVPQGSLEDYATATNLVKFSGQMIEY